MTKEFLKVEDGVFKDSRFYELMHQMRVSGLANDALGAKGLAAGSLLLAWQLARSYYIPDKNLIPQSVFYQNTPHAALLVDCGLAQRDGDFVYVCGTKRLCEFYFKRCEAGRLGGLAKASNAKQTLAGAKQNLGNLPEKEKEKEEEIQLQDELKLRGKLRRRFINPTSVGLPPPQKGIGSKRLMEIYNANRGSLPECRNLSKSRASKAALRGKEHPAEETWIELFQFLATSRWHLGENDRGWRANFDFAIQEKTMIRFQEGTLAGQHKRLSAIDNWVPKEDKI